MLQSILTVASAANIGIVYFIFAEHCLLTLLYWRILNIVLTLNPSIGWTNDLSNLYGRDHHASCPVGDITHGQRWWQGDSDSYVSP